jgi:plastocyanin
MYYGGGEGNLTTDSWDLSSYPSNTYLRIDHRYNWVVYNDSPSYDGGNVKVSTDNGENWSILKPVGGYPGTIYDYEDYGNPLYGQEAFVNFSGGQNHPEGVWVTDYFDLSIYTGLDNVKFKFHFGIYNYYWPGDYYHWHINDVSLVSGPLVPGFEFAGSGISSEYEIEEYEWYSSIDGFLSNQSHFSSFDLSDGKNHTIFFRIKDSYGFWSEYATTEIEVPDVTPPVVTIASGPDNIAVDTTATFRFTSNEHGSTFECALDGVEWVDCSSPKSYSNLTLSDHSFSVRAIDQSNNTSDTAYWNWTTRSQYVVYIEDNVYNSSYIEIVLGYAVTWVNNDDTLHTVTADDDLFDSGSLGPGDEWSYYFNDMGTYDYHCEYHDSMNGTVFVGDQPNESPIVWNITIDPNPAYEDERVYFDSDWEDSDGYVTVFEWTSDVDGLLSTNDSFDSDDLSIGNHTISFRVQDDDGEWSNWDTATLVIHPNTLPVADAGPDLKATPGSQATFFGSAVDTDGHIVLYEWDFDGDGVFDFSSSDNFSSHVYDEEGSYLVILRVTDNDGLTDTDTVEITISEEKVQIDDEGNVTVTDDKEDDEGNVTVTDAGEDEEGIPALSLITSIATIGIITLRRRS